MGARLGALLLAAAALGASGAPPRLQGPISDFWNQVKRDWARAIPGLRSGPLQTYEWISLVYAAPGEDDVLDALLEREMRTWVSVMQRKWVRSMFWKKPYHRLNREGFYGSRALRKNLVVMGTPGSNPLLGEMTRGTPFGLEGETIRIGGTEYTGRSLVLVFIRPNPLGEGTYTLVIAATHAEGLLRVMDLPLGPTDYVLFRGEHLVESGHLDWSQPGTVGLGVRRQRNPNHQGWQRAQVGPVRVHFNPAELRREDAVAFGEARRADAARLAALGDVDTSGGWDEYLYASLDAKMLHTSAPGPVSVDMSAGAVHRVWRPGEAGATWPAAMALLWRSWGATELTGLLYGLSLVPEGALEGQSLQAWAARLAQRGRRKPVEELIARRRFESAGGDLLDVLTLGAFLEHLVERHGLEKVSRFYREARAGSFRRAFRDVMGTSLGRAEAAWRRGLEEMAPAQAPPPPTHADPALRSRAAVLLARGEEHFLERRDRDAGESLRVALELDPGLARAHVLLARLAFRAGDDAGALEHGERALVLGTGDRELEAWARVTLGRSRAARGDLQAARLELTDPAVADGPPGPRILADYWLENLGMSPNRAAAARYLSQQAEIDLQRYDWESAEERVLRILTADPGNADAHHLLARIRLGKFQYWHDFAQLYNELFPGTDPSDPFQYEYLADSARVESARGAFLAAGHYAPLDLDVGEPLEPTDDGGFQRRGKAVSLPPAGIGGDQHSQHFQRAQGFYLAADWRRAESELQSLLGLGIPVSNFRALVLYLLALCQQEDARWDEASEHLREAGKIVRDKSLRAEIERALERRPLAPRTGPRLPLTPN